LEIDLRGLSCPVPVLKAKKALEESSEKVLCFLVDRGAPCENVSRLAAKQGCKVESKELDNGVELKIIRP
jgi:tRNA 2-thiouridine synthesizing protein A